MQKKTFTNWMNTYLRKVTLRRLDDLVSRSDQAMTSHLFLLLQRRPPEIIDDLFVDIRDGVKLMKLLEVLTGQKLASSCFTSSVNDL